MIRRPIKSKLKIALGVVSIVVLLGAYTITSWRQHQVNPKDTTIPSWTQLADGLHRITETNERTGDRWLLVDSVATAQRYFLGLGIGVLLSIALGLMMGCFTKIEAVIAPPLSFFAQIPPTAALAVFFVLAGLKLKMFVIMIVFGITPVLAMSVYLAAKEVPDELMYKAYTLGATNMEVIPAVIFRHALPKILDSVRLQIGPAMVYLIAAEMVVADVGFGYRIRLVSKRTDMAVVYPYLIILAAFGFLMVFGMRWLRRWWCPWYAGGR
jgi:NitT/TauT family transport system permease protein